MRWANESPYAQAVYDSLLITDPEFEVEPNLATEWEYNDDNTVLTLTLRDDVTFTNGDTLTAEDAAASLLGFRDGTSPNATLLRFVADAKAVDDTTLEITLSEPDPGLLTALSQNAGLVAPAELVDDPATATESVGSGPYILNTGETVVGSSYVFDKNEDYWNPDHQHYDKLILQVYTDASSLVNAVPGRPGERLERHRPDDAPADGGSGLHPQRVTARLAGIPHHGPCGHDGAAARRGQGPPGHQHGPQPRGSAPDDRQRLRRSHRPDLRPLVGRLRRGARHPLRVRRRRRQGAPRRGRLSGRLRGHDASRGFDPCGPVDADGRSAGTGRDHRELRRGAAERLHQLHPRCEVPDDVVPAADGTRPTGSSPSSRSPSRRRGTRSTTRRPRSRTGSRRSRPAPRTRRPRPASSSTSTSSRTRGTLRSTGRRRSS